MSSAELATSSEPVPTQDDVLGLSLEGLSTSSPSGGRKKGSKGKSKAKAGVEGLGIDGAVEPAGTERVSFVSPAAVSAPGSMKGPVAYGGAPVGMVPVVPSPVIPPPGAAGGYFASGYMQMGMMGPMSMGGMMAPMSMGYGPSPIPLQYPRPSFFQAPAATPFDRAGLLYSIVQQVEFYFSVENLVKDVYLRRHLDAEGYLPASFILGFRRLSQLCPNVPMLLEALAAYSVAIEVDTENEKIRLKDHWQQWLFPNQDGSKGVPVYKKLPSSSSPAPPAASPSSSAPLSSPGSGVVSPSPPEPALVPGLPTSPVSPPQTSGGRAPARPSGGAAPPAKPRSSNSTPKSPPRNTRGGGGSGPRAAPAAVPPPPAHSVADFPSLSGPGLPHSPIVATAPAPFSSTSSPPAASSAPEVRPKPSPGRSSYAAILNASAAAAAASAHTTTNA